MIALMRALALTGGEWVIYLLMVCSILAVAVIIERAIFFKRQRRQLHEVKNIFVPAIAEDAYLSVAEKMRGCSGFAAHVVTTGLQQAHQGPDSVEEQVSSVSGREKQKLEQRMILLGTLGNNAVYIGLFGTVLGVIKSFNDLAAASGSGPEVVMQGLSEALLATAAGLMVALPCVVAYNVFQKQIKDLVSESESMIRLLLSRLKAKPQ